MTAAATIHQRRTGKAWHASALGWDIRSVCGQGWKWGRRDLLIAGSLLIFGVLLVLPYSGPDVRKNPDTLFYEAQKLEVLGASRDEAVREAFDGEFGAELVRRDLGDPPEDQRVSDPEWRSYSAQFYRRRWTVPVLAAALDPLVGDRSIEYPSLIGWALLAPLLYVFLRRRFAPGVSAAVSVFCAVLPPMFAVGPNAGTDALGLALLVAGLLVAWQARTSGAVWLVPWAGLVLVLSFTRDATIVLVTATAWLFLAERSRQAALLLATGVLASLPAPLIFSAPIQENLAYAFNEFRIPAESTWSSIIAAYPGEAAALLKCDVSYPLRIGFPPAGLVMGALAVAGLAALYAYSARGDSFISLARGAGAGALATLIVSVNCTGMRLETVFVPVVAVGVALLAERLASRRSPWARE